MAFATVAQYRAKYNTELDDESLLVWLEDASGIMAAEMDAAHVDYCEPTDSMAARLSRVCRDMVHRAIGDGSDAAFAVPFGATQATQAAGGYSLSTTMGNPYGDLFIKRDEKRLLGIVRGGIGMARPSYGRLEPDDD